MAKNINIDNVRYSMEHQEYFQRQLEVVVNALVNQSNDENAKAFAWFMNIGNKNISSWNITNSGKTLVMGF
jgi:broad specificity polyphosphatase/5'/3'-nucleotidase SurE